MTGKHRKDEPKAGEKRTKDEINEIVDRNDVKGRRTDGKGGGAKGNGGKGGRKS